MRSVTKEDIKNTLKAIGLKAGDTVIFHSSLKSFGQVENGADTVIDAFLEVVGDEGTVVVPTLISKNFSDAYNTWYMDKPSDVGIITEVFRKRENALRSNQATHSVAAIGKNAAFLTETHGQSGLRFGIYGNTSFAKDSPWQKMYDQNAKVVLVGVDFDKMTFRHLFEYTLVDEMLGNAEKQGIYDEAIKSICSFEGRPNYSDTYFWPYMSHKLSEFAIPYVKSEMCGNALLKCVEIKTFGDALMKNVREHLDEWYEGNILDWFNTYK